METWQSCAQVDLEITEGDFATLTAEQILAE